MTDGIPRTAKDVVQKLIADVHMNALTSWYGLSDVDVVDVLPSSVPTVSIHEHLLDRVFLTASGEVLHVEFQSDPETDLHRFLTYAVALIDRYQCRIRTVVVYLYPAPQVPSRYDRGSVVFDVENVMIAEKSGPVTWKRLSRLVAEEWTDSDILDLTFYPFMDDVETRAERAVKAAQLATILPRPMQRRVVAMILGLTSTFLDKEVIHLVKGVLEMNDLIRELEEEAIQRGLTIGESKGFEEGKKTGLEEGRQEGRQEGTLAALHMFIIARFGSIPATIAPILLELTEEQMLQVIREISKIETVDALQSLLERG